MKLTFFKCRCLACFRSFEVPLLPDSSYGEHLFYDKTSREFFDYTVFDNKEISNSITKFFDENPHYQFLNDDSKGNTYWQIVALMADGDKECVLGRNRCPHCGRKFNYLSDSKTEITEIERLNFNTFLSLAQEDRNEYLLDKAKRCNL